MSKKNKEYLSKNEERYSLAMRASNDGLWDWDLKTDKICYSDRWKEMLGFNDDEISDTPKEWLSRVHQEDYDRVRASIDAYLEGTTSNFEIEYRIRHFSDNYLWMMAKGLAIRTSSGRATRFAGSQTDVSERKSNEEQMVYDALHDTLTSIPNRTLLLDRIRQSLVRRKRYPKTSFAIIFIDLDRFRLVNESLGHIHGDELLQLISARLKETIPIGDTVARLGGDEFSILLQDIDSVRDVEVIAKDIQNSFSKPFFIGDREVFASASMGIAHSDND